MPKCSREALNTNRILMKCVKTHYKILNVSYLTTAAEAAAEAAAAAEVVAVVAAAAAAAAVRRLVEGGVVSRTQPHQIALLLNNNYLQIE